MSLSLMTFKEFENLHVRGHVSWHKPFCIGCFGVKANLKEPAGDRIVTLVAGHVEGSPTAGGDLEEKILCETER